MRLTPQQLDCVLATAREVAGERVKVWLFGSRLDDGKRGGDVDLLVQSTPVVGLLDRARLKNRLEQRLGLPVDVVTSSEQGPHSPFAQMALAQGVPLP